jgi:tetratricopeptide (TPR) repeat protein
MQIKALLNMKTRSCAGIILAMLLPVLAGCATSGKEKTPVADESMPGRETLAVKGPAVTKLEGGRKGFIIMETPTMDDEMRRDFDRAVSMLGKEEYGQAIEILEKIIGKAPGVTAPYINAAIAYQRIGKQGQAEEHLKTALKLFPEHPVASNEYGLLYRRTGRFAEARTMYEKALARFPDYYPLHRNLGILCDMYQFDHVCALEHYEIYSSARPEDRQVKTWLADLHARLGRNQEGR